MAQITEKGESEKAKQKDKKKENYKKVVKEEKETINPFEVLETVSQICLLIAADSISEV